MGKKRKKGGTTKKTSAREERNIKARKIGENLTDIIDLEQEILELTYQEGMRADVLSRMFYKDVETLKTDKAINRIYRAAFKRQDELFSTAFTREFVKGFQKRYEDSGYEDDVFDYMEELIDMASNARIPTTHSGFATEDEIMQHPANRRLALFTDPYETGSLHSKLDTERRDYVERAMNEALENSDYTAVDVMIEGVKASIEFTLNYFTAPITADNVFQYTKNVGKKITDKKFQEQLASRERMKGLYVELGGQLRDLDSPETQLESVTRDWDHERGDDEEALVRPPSPFRQVFEY